MRRVLTYFSEVDFHQSPPAMGRDMHRIIRQFLHDADPYKKIKQRFNALMLENYPALREKVKNAPDSFNYALRLSIAGNIIDFGPNNSFDINNTLQQAASVTLAIDHSQQLQAAIRHAGTLLYLGDNAGEIVLDRLFLETIQHPNVYFAVRGTPIINDVTTADAFQVGIDRIATVISNGDDTPGTILRHTSDQFRDIFDRADLIIAKGQGNYESLSGRNENIYFLLMAKCDHVARHLGVSKGDFVVAHE